MAVITGGAGGIGLATARRFAAEGATLVIGNVDETAGMGAADLTNGLFTKVNVTDQDQVDALFDIAFLLYGSVNVAFNNAGISPADNASIELTELPDWHRASDVNLTSVYLCSRAALR